MKVYGLFAGIGGFERSLTRHGAECVGFCEIDPIAQAVLSAKFPGVAIENDVTQIPSIPETNIVSAGFPCQDLSQAGPKAGIRGTRSRLVDHVFRLIQTPKRKPDWVILENVSYMLKLQSGDAMQYILKEIEDMGYNWAYRVLDARSFGLPQRRQRVIFLISPRHDPSQALFPDGFIQPPINDSVGAVDPSCYYGFYWTEGKRGLGWTKNAVPTIKGGSGLGIPSPPAIWCPQSGFFGTPTIRDAERLFGYPSHWTEAAMSVSNRKGARWKLVGNTVCVPMVDWVFKQVLKPQGLNSEIERISPSDRPPQAAFGLRGQRWKVNVSTWPRKSSPPKLNSFLLDDLTPLSHRAASGFFKRAMETTTIRFADGFLNSLRNYISNMEAGSEANRVSSLNEVNKL